MFREGIYEQLITKLVASRLAALDRDNFYVNTSKIDRVEAARVLSLYIGDVTRFAMGLITGDDSLERQLDLANRIILLLKQELSRDAFDTDLLESEGRILNAVFNRLDADVASFDFYLGRVMPFTRLSQSELFTGGNAGISLESELKKEILSADEINLLVSFIKWTGIRIFEPELLEFTRRGGRLRVITTSYMGATDPKAVEFLSKLPSTEVKISYNTDHERLHAKAYLFYRNSGFHTGYIGSSNVSRSALTTGLEWNLKVTTKEVGHIIDKFQKTFDTYWQDKEFETFDTDRDLTRFRVALQRENRPDPVDYRAYFDIKPFPFQQEILEKLEVERSVHNRNRNLLVAATGTGKTVVSAFDYKAFRSTRASAKLLFVAHRKEILQQAQATFQGVLKDYNFGELWVDGIEPTRYDHVFASVQTLNNRLATLALSADYYDFIVIDEVHHIAAASYRPIIERFTPKVLLGLTATPERMDNADILTDFCGTIAAEIRLPEALNRRLLCPFQYFGISDNVDLSAAEWRNGRYVVSDLTRLYTQDDNRVSKILADLDRYLADPTDVRALCFCVSQEHARYMSEKFNFAGYKSDVLVSDDTSNRDGMRRRLREKEINYLFVVDIFNEGVDIPEVDTVLFLRPTESLTVFLQQLGRGLRLAEGKECLTVLDFVGNSRPEYDYEGKFRALIGRTNTPTTKEVENEFPHLPLGCSIVLEEKAREYILKNIRQATALRRQHLVSKIQNFSFQTNLNLSLKNFCSFYNIPPPTIYAKATWGRLCVEAGRMDDVGFENEQELKRAASKKWLACNSTSYFRFILQLAERDFAVSIDDLSESERAMCLMLHYDFWQVPGGFSSLEESIRAIGKNPAVKAEIIELIRLIEDRTDFLETEISLGYEQPLKLHARYTRDQILSAFGLYTFNSKPNYIEGNAYSREKNTDLLFITLDKSEKDYSPTTRYEDFAIDESLFHWQSRNDAGPDTVRGKEIIDHERNGRQMLLFVREKNSDAFGTAMGSVFLGKASLVDYSGSKPMNIRWKLDVPMPPYIWKESAKMAIG